jgi:hypothetical protein
MKMMNEAYSHFAPLRSIEGGAEVFELLPDM